MRLIANAPDDQPFYAALEIDFAAQQNESGGEKLFSPLSQTDLQLLIEQELLRNFGTQRAVPIEIVAFDPWQCRALVRSSRIASVVAALTFATAYNRHQLAIRVHSVSSSGAPPGWCNDDNGRQVADRE